MIEVHHANEPLQLLLRLGLWEVADRLKFLRERGDSLVVDAMAEKVQLRHTKTALVWIYQDTICGESLEDSSQIMDRGGVSDENIINVAVGW